LPNLLVEKGDTIGDPPTTDGDEGINLAYFLIHVSYNTSLDNDTDSLYLVYDFFGELFTTLLCLLYNCIYSLMFYSAYNRSPFSKD
jgi:hypothetical protein